VRGSEDRSKAAGHNAEDRFCASDGVVWNCLHEAAFALYAIGAHIVRSADDFVTAALASPLSCQPARFLAT